LEDFDFDAQPAVRNQVTALASEAFLTEARRVGTTSTTPVTLSDQLAGGVIRPGTRGVVTAVTGSRVTVDFDSGRGLHTATVSAQPAPGPRRRRHRPFPQPGPHHQPDQGRPGHRAVLSDPSFCSPPSNAGHSASSTESVPAFLTAFWTASATDRAAIAYPMHTLVCSDLTGLIIRWLFRQ